MPRISEYCLLVGSCFLIASCASGGHLNTSTGKPTVALTKADWKQASVAIAEYNLAKGRQLDIVRPNEIVLYDAVPAPDGKEQVTSKTVYFLTSINDSLIISSRRYETDDLDEESPTELVDQASLDAQQQELSEIARNATNVTSESPSENLANPTPSQ